MDSRMQKDEHFVDVIGIYHFAFIAFGLCVPPFEWVQGPAIVALIIYAFYIYAKRRKIMKVPVPSELKLSHINLLITNFWRFNYLCLVSFALVGGAIALFGDHTAWNEIQAQALHANQEQLNALAKQYQADNRSLALLSNLLFFQPLIWYILFKMYKGYQAFKKDEVVDPKSWAVK